MEAAMTTWRRYIVLRRRRWAIVSSEQRDGGDICVWAGEGITRHILMEHFFIAIKFSSLWAVYCVITVVVLVVVPSSASNRVFHGKNAQTAIGDPCDRGEWYLCKNISARPLRSPRLPVVVFFYCLFAAHTIGVPSALLSAPIVYRRMPGRRWRRRLMS